MTDKTEYETEIERYIENLPTNDQEIMLNGAKNMMELYSRALELDEIPEYIHESLKISSTIVKIYNL